ncbi:MAG: hypothetical protein WBO32_01085 [Cyclobacteriaceae bacterium]
MSDIQQFKATYTILTAWASGSWEQAVKAYFKIDDYISRQMAEGRDFHKECEEHIKTTKSLPEIFGGRKLSDPKSEQYFKVAVPGHDWLLISGVIDCLDTPAIHEFKTGSQSSEEYANSNQTGIYAVLATLSGLYVDRAYIYHYDQYTKQVDTSMVWLTDKLLKETMEWIVKYSWDMHQYLLSQDAYNKLGHYLVNKNNNHG